MKNGAVVTMSDGKKLDLHTPLSKTEIDEDILLRLAGFQPVGKVYGAETTAAHDFLGTVESYLQVLGENGYLQRLKTPAEIANVLSTQILLKQALARLLFKRATGVKGGTVVIIFNILADDYVAPILKALIQDNAHKALADEIVPGGKLPKFEVEFEAMKKAPKQEQLPAPAATAEGSQAKK